MSLFSLLNGTSTSTSSTSTSSTMSTLLAQIEAKTGSSSTTSSTTKSGTTASSVSITVSAQRAAAEAADGKKEASALIAELRKAFDAEYAKHGDKKPDTSQLSGRALALVAINQDGSFSKSEVAAAKSELRERDRASALALINSGDLTAATLITYNKQLLTERAAMSAEERALRDINPKLR